MELRTVLTAEVAQRHDQIVDLHDELKEYEQKQHETRMQLHLKNEIIKDLRREIKSLKTNSEVCDKVKLQTVEQSTGLSPTITYATSMMTFYYKCA